MQSEARFTATEDREAIGEYRKVSALAIGSLVLGLASVGALAHPGAWVTPVLAVVCGVFGLLSIRKHENVGGGAVAWAGVTLGFFFLCWATTQYYFDRWVVYTESQEVGRKWLQLVLDGEDLVAHQAMLNPAIRQSVSLSVDEYYEKDEAARKDRDKLYAEPPARDLLAMGRDARIEFVENVTQDVDLGRAKMIRQIYRVSAPGKEPVDVMLTITREYRDDLGRANWIVADCLAPK